jgi:hypothetical protein
VTFFLIFLFQAFPAFGFRINACAAPHLLLLLLPPLLPLLLLRRLCSMLEKRGPNLTSMSPSTSRN